MTCAAGGKAYEAPGVDDIEAGAAELDSIFSRQMRAGRALRRTADAHVEHARALAVVGRIQQRTDLLAKRFEDAIGDLQSFCPGKPAIGPWLERVLPGLAPLLAGEWPSILAARLRGRLRFSMPEQTAGSRRPDTSIAVGGNDEFATWPGSSTTLVASLKEQQHRLLQSERLAGVAAWPPACTPEINNPLGS